MRLIQIRLALRRWDLSKKEVFALEVVKMVPVARYYPIHMNCTLFFPLSKKTKYMINQKCLISCRLKTHFIVCCKNVNDI